MDKCKNCGEDTVTVTAEEFTEMRKQIADMHAFIKGLAEALNNPMLKAMLPPHMRGMLGG